MNIINALAFLIALLVLTWKYVKSVPGLEHMYRSILDQKGLIRGFISSVCVHDHVVAKLVCVQSLATYFGITSCFEKFAKIF